MQRWYVARGTTKDGPYSPADLRNLSLSGQVRETDMLLLEGSVKWVPALSIKGLFNPPLGAPDLMSASAVRPRATSKGRNPGTGRLVKALVYLLIILIIGGACWHFVREYQFQNQLTDAESTSRAKSATIASLERRLADAEARANAIPASPNTALASQESPKEEQKITEDAARVEAAKVEAAKAEAAKAEAAKAEAAKAEMAKAREALIAELQQRVGELDRKDRESAAQVTLLEKRLAEAVKKEREARAEAEAAQKLPADTDKPAPAVAAALRERIGMLRKRLAQVEKEKAPYEFIDKHALDAPKEVAQSVPSLAQYLTAPALTDTEKARAIFRWIAANLAYDVDALFNGGKSDNSPDGVLRDRKCLCEGYVNLFCALADASALEAVKISGYAKGWGYQPGEKADPPNHAWVTVKLGGAWSLIDPTWGAGFTSSEKVYVPHLNEFYFLTPPDQFIMSHLPSDPRWQLLDQSVAAEEFEKWGKIDHMAFRYGLSAKQIRDKLSEESFEGLVKMRGVDGVELTIQKAPLDGKLKAGSAFHVRIDAPGVHGLSISVGGKRIPFTKKGSTFDGRVDRLPQGPATVMVQPSSGPMHWVLLEYTVE